MSFEDRYPALHALLVWAAALPLALAVVMLVGFMFENWLRFG